MQYFFYPTLNSASLSVINESTQSVTALGSFWCFFLFFLNWSSSSESGLIHPTRVMGKPFVHIIMLWVGCLKLSSSEAINTLCWLLLRVTKPYSSFHYELLLCSISSLQPGVELLFFSEVDLGFVCTPSHNSWPGLVHWRCLFFHLLVSQVLSCVKSVIGIPALFLFMPL